MQEITGNQLPELIPFTMLPWQGTFCQILYEQASPILSGKHSIALFPTCNQVAGLTLGLDQVSNLTYVWPIKTCFL